MLNKLLIAALTLTVSVAPAFAHLNPDEHGSLLAGVSHPLFGPDHILAMIAVGLWAALLGSKTGRKPALWPIPSAFVGTMIVGFAAALAGMPLPFVEPVILASVVVIGLLAAVALQVPILAGMVLVGFFAFFHGHAHGGELGAAGAISFGMGFALSTALLHAIGIGFGLQFGRLFGGEKGRAIARALGGVAALSGLWLAMAA
ncbi:urease accessory protein [Mesorhizobium sp. L-8-10]|uniref:HupE/UreJ family protein n=1 Tax=Mesorhizobium sp. L-8-10 TaxID=2744523 RepID=UPI0019266CFB|nr:HupE/UreJ family protein [Mesorhizobium sp. L-8-10]BCH32468.1 urease accessory protein [Mesorhizobium sp. L-8-10]